MKNQIIDNFLKDLNLKNSQNNKYNYVRNQLDKMKFIQSFDEYSVDLVETLLNEIINNKNEILKLNKTLHQNKEYIKELNITLNAFKYKSESIIKENKDLHSEIVKLTEKFSKKDSNIETQLHQLRDDNSSLKYLVTDLKKKLKLVQIENSKFKDIYRIFTTSLFEKSINIKQMYLNQKEEEENDPKNPHSKPMNLETFEKNVYSIIKKPKIEITENLNVSSKETIENYFPKPKYYPINTINEEYQKQILNLKNDLKSLQLENSIMKKQMLSFFNYEYLDNKLYLNDNPENTNFKSFNNNNPIVIDFLRNELRTMKEKYESYIDYFNKNRPDKSQTLRINNIKKLNERIDKISEENKNLKKQINDINYQKDQIENEKDFLKNTLKKEIEKSKIKKDIIVSISKNQSIQFLYTKKKDNSKEQISKLLNEKKILEDENSQMKKNIRNLNNQKDKLNSELIYNNHQIAELIDKCNSLNKTIYENNINSINNNFVEEKNKQLTEELNKTNCSIEDIKKENESKLNLLKHELLIKEKEILRLNEINKMYEIQIQMFDNK